MSNKKKTPVVVPSNDEFEASLRGQELPEEVKEFFETNYDSFSLGIVKIEGGYNIVKVPIDSKRNVAGPLEVIDFGKNKSLAMNKFKKQMLEQGVFKL